MSTPVRRDCRSKEPVLSPLDIENQKQCTFKPRILSTKKARDISGKLKPSRDMRMQDHLERKQTNLSAKRQQLLELQEKELKFKPQISKYDKPPTAPKIQRSQTDQHLFKPKISKNSENIIKTLTREKDCSQRLYQEANTR